MPLINTAQAPGEVLKESLQGYIFQARGGRNAKERFFLCVADRTEETGYLHFLMIDKDGEVVGSNSYASHAFENRYAIGKIKGDFGNFDVVWFRQELR